MQDSHPLHSAHFARNGFKDTKSMESPPAATNIHLMESVWFNKRHL